ncbi:MAG: GNAT family N-acetyltransferase [Bacillota bacterium]|nr:GNAT family N-acetyltransferase [Bacillota bacterium]
MNKIALTEKDIEEIISAFNNQKIQEPQKGELYYFSKQESTKYIQSYLQVNDHSGFVYGLEGKEGFVIIRRENECYKLLDIFRLIINTYRAIGFQKVRRISKLEREAPLAIEEKYAFQKKKFLFLGLVVVKEQFQHRGYFRMLLEEVFEMARKENRLIILNTDTIEKCKKYEHLGFKLVQKRVLEENNIRYDLVWKP